MSSFHYRNNQLYVEHVPLAHIAAQWGTPTYVYSFSALLANYQAFNQALQQQPHLIVMPSRPIAILPFAELFSQTRLWL